MCICGKQYCTQQQFAPVIILSANITPHHHCTMSSCLLSTMSSEAPHLPDELPPIGGQFRGYARRFLYCMMTPKMMSRLGNHTIFSALTSWAWFSNALAQFLIFMLIHSCQLLDNWVQRRTSVNLTASLERAQVTTTAEWWKNQASIAKRQQKFNFVMQQPTSTIGKSYRLIVPIVTQSLQLGHFFLGYFESSTHCPNFFARISIFNSLERNTRRILGGGTAGKLVQKVNAFVNSCERLHLHVF